MRSHIKLIFVSMVLLPVIAWAQSDELKVIEGKDSIDIVLPEDAKSPQSGLADQTLQPGQRAVKIEAKTAPATGSFDPLKYKLGPDDVVEIVVLRHPEFSGIYPIDKEGKLQYKFVGDLNVKGMTKKELEDKVLEIISKYVISPEVNVTITEFRSKVIYILGEVGSPGKYYMRSETVPVMEALVMAGLPTYSAALRKTQIITPSMEGNTEYKKIDLFALLYKGDLKKNVELYPGQVLYIPCTVMAKVIRVISPATNVVTNAASGKAGGATLATGVP